jgi:PAS domain-containing protein
MDAVTATVEKMLAAAIEAVASGGELFSTLDALPAPIYVTDPDGFVTHFNQACIGLAGRTPTAGKDRWCVTWKLYTASGEFLPHDQCPMAIAIRTKTAIRGVTAVAERPDGTRVVFMPFPTPLMGQDGELRGAINLLIDVTEIRQAAELRDQAHRCRRLAFGLNDRPTIDAFNQMAAEYDAKASELENAERIRQVFSET